ncbi:MFS transporter [Longimicrobium sp.]|uniref:MFS transporter n=1 Tax=Longimicrobium sp. TaxID=2029185 RepID=UPI002E37FFBF|nr:MFS transporter [Longimicrobium sp.]HEX6039436.1 MFS transporter [Longimicrobium sp.]
MARGAGGSGAAAERPSLLRALRSRNYRLFFAGQSVSLVGTWITRVATSWLVYRLTGSAAMLGIVGFASQIPTFVLAPFAGVWVDRLNRYRVLVITQVLAMLQSFALAALALAGTIEVWHVLWLGALQGVINAFDTPARQAMLVDLVEDRADLPNAIALNSSMVNGARLIGPSVAGIVIAAVGEAWCFLADGISYVAVIVSLLLMAVPKGRAPRRDTRVMQELTEGFRYAFGFRPIRAVLILLAVVSLTGMPYTVLMPVIADKTLHGGPHTLGFLMGASGVGALGGALYLASRRSVLGLGRVIPIAAAVFGIGLVAFGASRSLPLSLVLMLLTGSGFMVQMASSNTILQTIVREDMRGRVMAFYTMAFMGTTPFGSLLAGGLAARIGAERTLMAGGVACVAAAAVFARVLPELRRQVRPLYVERGILPPIADGLSSSTAMRQEVER